MKKAFYTKEKFNLLEIDYQNIHKFGIDVEEYPNKPYISLSILYHGQVWDCEKKEFVNPKDLGCYGVQISKYGKFIECYWIELEIHPTDFMQQMCEDLNTLQRELDKQSGK